MAFDCSTCVAKCRAVCCGPVPLEPKFIEKHKAQRPILRLIPFGDNLVIPETADNRCAFLGPDDKCSVYDDRPGVCRTFGDESHPLMTCAFQAKDGRIRSRQERRQLERSNTKRVEGAIAEMRREIGA